MAIARQVEGQTVQYVEVVAIEVTIHIPHILYIIHHQVVLQVV